MSCGPAARSSSRPAATPASDSPSSRSSAGTSASSSLPDKVGEDKIDVLRAYGAEVVVTPTSVAADSPESYYSVSDRLAREIPGAFKPNQYENPNGPRSHYETTGPEIWRDTDGHDHALRRRRRHRRHDHRHRPLPARGLGRPRAHRRASTPRAASTAAAPGARTWSRASARTSGPAPTTRRVPHEIVAVGDAESFAMTRRLAREEGILVGGSSGMAVVGALRIARELPADAVMVVLLPDGGRGYLGKIFNDGWMRSYGFSEVEEGETVADVLAPAPSRHGEGIPDLVHAHPTDTVLEAIGMMTEYDVSQLVVLSAEPPVMMGEVVGTVDEKGLLDLLFRGDAKPTDAVGDARRGAAAAHRHPRTRSRRRAPRSPTSTRCWSPTTASRTPCSPVRTCSRTSRAEPPAIGRAA